jgi:monooxygenase
MPLDHVDVLIVLRSLARLPKQGPSAPWRLYQNYPRDLLLMRRGRLDDAGIRFTRASTPVRQSHSAASRRPG